MIEKKAQLISENYKAYRAKTREMLKKKIVQMKIFKKILERYVTLPCWAYIITTIRSYAHIMHAMFLSTVVIRHMGVKEHILKKNLEKGGKVANHLEIFDRN